MPIVCWMHGAATDLGALNFTIDEPLSGDPFVKTIIFVNTRELAYKTSKHLKTLLPPELASKVDFMHAGRLKRVKRKVMKDFREGRVSILGPTEAAGMVRATLNVLTLLISSKGMDILDVAHVVGFMVPSSFSVWVQRYGRVGRNGNRGKQSYWPSHQSSNSERNIESKTMPDKVKMMQKTRMVLPMVLPIVLIPGIPRKLKVVCGNGSRRSIS